MCTCDRDLGIIASMVKTMSPQGIFTARKTAMLLEFCRLCCDAAVSFETTGFEERNVCVGYQLSVM